MVLYRYWTVHDTIILIIIWMYTSILGNKQSTINSYMYFSSFFSLFTYKKVWGGHKLIKLVHDSNFSLPQIDASHAFRANREQTLMQSQKRKRRKTKGELLALLTFHSSHWTDSLFLLLNAERSLKAVTFPIRTSAGRVRFQSAGGTRRNGATQRPRSHHAWHRALQEKNTILTPSPALACLTVQISINSYWLEFKCSRGWDLLLSQPNESITLVL